MAQSKRYIIHLHYFNYNTENLTFTEKQHKQMTYPKIFVILRYHLAVRKTHHTCFISLKYKN